MEDEPMGSEKFLRPLGIIGDDLKPAKKRKGCTLYVPSVDPVKSTITINGHGILWKDRNNDRS